MGESLSLRLCDVRAVFRLVAECRELGDDAARWRTHLVEGAMRLVGARVGMCGEIVLTDKNYTAPLVELGWEADQAKICHDYWREHLGKDDLYWHRVASDERGGFLQATTRQDYVPNHEWYALGHVHECLRPANVDGLIMSGGICRSTQPTLDRFSVFRGWREKLFSERERRLVQLLHDEVVPLIGLQLAAADEPAPSGLTPRKHEVLESLLEGDTDKQIARRLGLSKATVNEYVIDVFRHFGTNSRAQLFSLFLRRFRKRR